MTIILSFCPFTGQLLVPCVVQCNKKLCCWATLPLLGLLKKFISLPAHPSGSVMTSAFKGTIRECTPVQWYAMLSFRYYCIKYYSKEIGSFSLQEPSIIAHVTKAGLLILHWGYLSVFRNAYWCVFLGSLSLSTLLRYWSNFPSLMLRFWHTTPNNTVGSCRIIHLLFCCLADFISVTYYV